MKDAAGALVAAYRYDALGRRVRKDLYDTAGAIDKVIDEVWDGWRLIEEYEAVSATATPSLARWFAYGNGIDEPLVMHVVDAVHGDKDYYYHQDALGSVAALTDSTGAVAESYEYDPYGTHVRISYGGTRTPNAPSTLSNPFLYAGRYFDHETGLYYNRHRYYDPALGRFISSDPIGYLGGINLYEYVGSQPINFVDPLGLRGLWPETMEEFKNRTKLGDRSIDYLFSQDETSKFAQTYYDLYMSDANSHRGDVTVGFAARRDEFTAYNNGTTAIRTVGTTSNIGIYAMPYVGLPLIGIESIISFRNHDYKNAALFALPFIAKGLFALARVGQEGAAAAAAENVTEDLPQAEGNICNQGAGELAGTTEAATTGKGPNPLTGEGYGVNDSPVRIPGEWSDQDYRKALMGKPPEGLGNPELHHADMMPGSGIHEVLPEYNNFSNKALHPNRFNQGVTGSMRNNERKLHWWYRAREMGADELYPDLIYDE